MAEDDTGKLSAEDEALIAAQGSGSSAATESAKRYNIKETKEAGGKVSAPTITSEDVALPEGFNTTVLPSTGTETTTGQTNPEDALLDSLKGKRSPAA